MQKYEPQMPRLALYGNSSRVWPFAFLQKNQYACSHFDTAGLNLPRLPEADVCNTNETVNEQDGKPGQR
jgi:hypothetical protein